MEERRKFRDRRVNPPKPGLPFYYTRHIADRRNSASAAWTDSRKDMRQPEHSHG
jgi:hypothetical protein